jgi:hypothetical protein
MVGKTRHASASRNLAEQTSVSKYGNTSLTASGSCISRTNNRVKATIRAHTCFLCTHSFASFPDTLEKPHRTPFLGLVILKQLFKVFLGVAKPISPVPNATTHAGRKVAELRCNGPLGPRIIRGVHCTLESHISTVFCEQKLRICKVDSQFATFRS